MNILNGKLAFFSAFLTSLVVSLPAISQSTTPLSRAISVLPKSTLLTATPRASFKPTARKGYWNIDVVGDFTLPTTKSLTFCGAGRNLHVEQDWSKLFRRGFSSIDQTRMVPDEINSLTTPKPGSWKSRLKQSQRTFWVPGQYFGDAPFALGWARNSDLASVTYFRRPVGDPNYRNSLYAATEPFRWGCGTYGDCPSAPLGSYGLIFLDVENEGVSHAYQQDHINLYVYMTKMLKDNVSPQTLIGSINPVPANGFGASAFSTYRAGPHWLWSNPAQHTQTSRERGMPDDIVGKSFGELIDVQMPGVYFVYPDFDYSIGHSGDTDRHWLAGILAEQEVNMKLSAKKRIAWQWLFNTQSGHFANSSKAEHAAPPAIAEGLAIFYWFTGAYGALFWDDWNALTPDLPSPTDLSISGLGNDRNYACYEHYLHGLWRLFKHHGDLFNGKELYLNDQTECSFDGGKSWVKYNANTLKTLNLPFVRAIVNGSQILIAATRPYAKAGQITRLKIRYIENGYNFYTDIALSGDEIFLGRASMVQSESFKGKAIKRITASRGNK